MSEHDIPGSREIEGDLSSHLPTRVLPVSTMPASDFDYLIDREYRLVADLLAPGRRAQDEARGRIRAMLAMESHVADHVEVGPETPRLSCRLFPNSSVR